MILRAILPLLLFTATLSAEEEFGFIGGSINYHHMVLTSLDDTSHTIGAFHAGRQTLRWRTTFDLEIGNHYGGAGMQVDYILFDSLFGTPKIRPYLGGRIHYLHYDHDQLQDDNGYSVGGAAGLILYAADRVDIDLGYHYECVEKIVGVDRMQGASLSIHYFY